jgi:hypothetical protein
MTIPNHHQDSSSSSMAMMTSTSSTTPPKKEKGGLFKFFNKKASSSSANKNQISAGSDELGDASAMDATISSSSIDSSSFKDKKTLQRESEYIERKTFWAKTDKLDSTARSMLLRWEQRAQGCDVPDFGVSIDLARQRDKLHDILRKHLKAEHKRIQRLKEKEVWGSYLNE